MKVGPTIFGRAELSKYKSDSLVPSMFSADNPDSQAVARLATLAKLGLNFSHIIDVGANRGRWTKDAMKIWPLAAFLLVEANHEHSRSLHAVSRSVVITVLGDTSRANVKFWQSVDGRNRFHDTGNSLFKEGTGKHWWTHPTTLNMSTLDDVVSRNVAGTTEWSIPQLPTHSDGSLMLKMDVQGAEELVLRGSTKYVLPRCGAILAELSILPYNIGAPLANQMLSFLASLGYRLYDILALHYNRRGLLIQIDALFLRQNHPFWRNEITGLLDGAS